MQQQQQQQQNGLETALGPQNPWKMKVYSQNMGYIWKTL